MNPLEQDLEKNREIVMDHYHYTKSGADFTVDMHEKHPMADAVRAPPVLKTHYIATKTLDMGKNGLHSSFVAPSLAESFHKDGLKSELTVKKIIDTKVHQKADISSIDLNDTEEGSTAESGNEPRINKIKKSCAKPIFQDIEGKTPKQYDDFVNNLIDHYIPSILIAPTNPCAKLLIFYHANAEDIGQAYGFCKEVNDKLEVNST